MINTPFIKAQRDVLALVQQDFVPKSERIYELKYWVTSQAVSDAHNFEITVWAYRENGKYFWIHEVKYADSFTSDEIEEVKRTIKIQYPSIEIETRRF